MSVPESYQFSKQRHHDLVLTILFTCLGLLFMVIFGSNTVQLIITYSMPVTSLCTLFDGGILSLFSPPPFSISFLCVIYVLAPVVCGLGILLCSNGTACMSLSSNWPAAFFMCSHKYCVVVIRLLYMCFVFHVINLPVFVTWMMYDYPLWSMWLASSITPHVQSPLTSHCTATINPKEKSIIVLNIFSLTGHEGLKLSIIVINVYRFSNHLRL